MTYNTNYARIYTNKVLDMVYEGELTWEMVAHACLGYMSEQDVKDMAQTEWDVDTDNEESEDDDTDE
jgi:hypothetical protein